MIPARNMRETKTTRATPAASSPRIKTATAGSTTTAAITAIGMVKTNITLVARSIFSLKSSKRSLLKNSERVGKTAVATDVPSKVCGICIIQ